MAEASREHPPAARRHRAQDRPQEPGAARLSAAERRDRLRLIRTERIGPHLFRKLLARYGSAARALAALPEMGARIGAAIRPCPAEAAEREIAAIAAAGGMLLHLGEPGYPEALAAVWDAPPVLAVRGAGAALTRPCVAVVGSRNASAIGVRFARLLAEELGKAGYVVVSGFARGIDAAAHEGSTATGTVAVFAGGADVVYPPEHERLAERILEAGAIVSEVPLGTAPLARHFPKRNRIISGLSLAVVVVEATEHSGTLITARTALEQGRELCAVPGSPLDPRARGANRLIREGATLVQGGDDVIAVLEPMRARPPAPVSVAEPEPPVSLEADAAAREAVFALLAPSPVPVDEILRQCQVSPSVAQTAIFELELAGRLRRHPGNLISLP